MFINSYIIRLIIVFRNGGTRWRSWLRHCVTSRWGHWDFSLA